MRIVHVLRKPFEGTVAGNISKHGCGGLNIDRCRIKGLEGEHIAPGGLSNPSNRIGTFERRLFHEGKDSIEDFQQAQLDSIERANNLGRWPANLILQHLPECERKGTRRVKGHKGYPNGPGGKRSEDVRPNAWAGHADEDGLETGDWVCGVRCPVAALDEQTGELSTCGGPKTIDSGDRSMFGIGQPGAIYPDTGGASRFFQQQGSKEGLVTYLADLIAPDHLADCIVLGVFEDGLDLAAMDLESAHGAVVDVDGPPVRALDRVLKPGAHVLLISPDGDPTGHAGAIAFEDAGFEVRDAILVIDAPEDRTHYVSKPSRREREAGCFALPCVTGAAAVEREEGSAGTRSPRAGAGRTADEVRNRHPTVKPVEIMERLLMDVPTDAPVIDPFMGSGTTMVACLRTGHDGIGIERDPSYIPIADARVRHWDRDVAGWSPVRIESDVEPQPEEAAEVSLADLLGL